MATSLDFGTPNGQVRLLIADTDESNPIFPYGTPASPDDAVDAFIAMARANHVKRAASAALRAIATNEILLQKKIKTLDLSTDGPAQSAELRALADSYLEEADTDTVEGTFDQAELVITNQQYEELTYFQEA